LKRSQINQIIREAMGFCRRMNFSLPPFAFWTPAEWRDQGHEYDEIRDTMLGWDCTDFGSGRYAERGLALFTIRNGHQKLSETYPKPYCEKLLIVSENQVTPHHYHHSKVEDIICRGGGNLLVQVWRRDAADGLSDEAVPVNCDGRAYTVPPGATIRLTPGESITLPQFMYHTFWAEAGAGTALCGEVSKVNDDHADNRFLEELPRFSSIEEDEAPAYLLCNEYPPAR
jgi:D-lyxose ketol-isomerase